MVVVRAPGCRGRDVSGRGRGRREDKKEKKREGSGQDDVGSRWARRTNRLAGGKEGFLGA